MEVFVKINRQIAQNRCNVFVCFGRLYENYLSLLTEKLTDDIISYSYHIRGFARCILDVSYASMAGRVDDASKRRNSKDVFGKNKIY